MGNIGIGATDTCHNDSNQHVGLATQLWTRNPHKANLAPLRD
jgi:hypothetical protein